jgi:hypothetical protein
MLRQGVYMFKLLLIFCTSFLLTSCKNALVKNNPFSANSEAATESSNKSYYNGSWVSEPLTLDESGSIYQQLLQYQDIKMNKTSKTSVDKIMNEQSCKSNMLVTTTVAQVALYFNGVEYIWATLFTYSQEGEEKKCTAITGRGTYYTTGEDYVTLEDIKKSFEASRQEKNTFTLNFN